MHMCRRRRTRGAETARRWCAGIHAANRGALQVTAGPIRRPLARRRRAIPVPRMVAHSLALGCAGKARVFSMITLQPGLSPPTSLSTDAGTVGCPSRFTIASCRCDHERDARCNCLALILVAACRPIHRLRVGSSCFTGRLVDVACCVCLCRLFPSEDPPSAH